METRTIHDKLITKIGTTLSISIHNVDLAKGAAYIGYEIKGEGEVTPIYNGYILLEGAEYSAWGDDDNYIWNLVASKLDVSFK